MKTQNNNENTLKMLVNPFYLSVIILAAPFFAVYKLVEWASLKSDQFEEKRAKARIQDVSIA